MRLSPCWLVGLSVCVLLASGIGSHLLAEPSDREKLPGID